jgi:niacin transporter
MMVSALFIALGVILPLVFHQFGIAGRIFLPMHYPVILSGFLLGPLWGALVGVLCPPLSFLISGMPRLPSLLLMVPELLTYGLLAGLLSPKIGLRSWWHGAMILFSVLIGGRLVYGLAATFFGPIFLGIDNPLLYIGGALLSGLPGALIILILLPPLIIRIQKAMPTLSPPK